MRSDQASASAAVGVTDRPLGGFLGRLAGALRAYLGAHDPAAPNDLALLGAHGQRLQPKPITTLQ
jgi:hypothetical protein